MSTLKKSDVRKLIIDKKKVFSLDEKKNKSFKIFDQIEKLDVFQKSKVIMVYWSMPDEVFTHDFVQKYVGKKKIILPVVKGDVLVLKEFTGTSNMVVGQSFGISEPGGVPFEELDKIDIIIVPGVAFDKDNNRLGRGKAYYDKLLSQTNALKIGVCFDFQIIESVPVDKHDIKMDLVISD